MYYDIMLSIFQGFHNKFPIIHSNILLIEPLPLIEKLFNCIKQEKLQLYINNLIIRLLIQLHTTFMDNQCLGPYCDHGNKHDHTRTTCFKFHEYLSGQRSICNSNKSTPEFNVNVVVPYDSFENPFTNLTKEQL